MSLELTCHPPVPDVRHVSYSLRYVSEGEVSFERRFDIVSPFGVDYNVASVSQILELTPRLEPLRLDYLFASERNAPHTFWYQLHATVELEWMRADVGFVDLREARYPVLELHVHDGSFSEHGGLPCMVDLIVVGTVDSLVAFGKELSAEFYEQAQQVIDQE